MVLSWKVSLKIYHVSPKTFLEFLISHGVFCRNSLLQTFSLHSSSKVYAKVNKLMIYLLTAHEADLQEHKRDIAKRAQPSVLCIALVF